MKSIKFFMVAVLSVLCLTASAQRSATNGTSKGYQGFIEGKLAFGGGDYSAAGVFTSHGYQFNPYVFFGGGAGLMVGSSSADGYVDRYIDDKVMVPIYANIKINILNKKISPMIDGKLGYSISDAKGLFFATSVGCRIRLGNHAIIPSLGYKAQQLDVKYLDKTETYGFTTLGCTFEF